MNFEFYGHCQSAVICFNMGGIYNETHAPIGIKIIQTAVELAAKSGNIGGFASGGFENIEDFRREYYEMKEYKNAEGKKYYTSNRYLGHREGSVPHSIMHTPAPNQDAPTDMLFVWDEGFGGLKLPQNAHNVFWVSRRALPDKQEFESIADKCFMVLDADILRRAGAMISRQISWERTASELIKEIQTNPAISHLQKVKYLFVIFEMDGGVFLLKKDDGFEAALMLAHGGSEGATREKIEGEPIGAFEMMTSILSQHFPVMLSKIANDEKMDLTRVFAKNFGKETTAVSIASTLRQILEIGENIALQGFQLNDVQDDLTIELNVKVKSWDAFSIPLENGFVPQDWIITNNFANKQMYDVAFEYVQKGERVIDGLPQLSFGALTTIDRWEIESYQNIRNLILSYAKGEAVRPLSIAVFGSPGSGKSFGVTQIAKNILPGKVEKLEFNVSQFATLRDLSVAFQKVRDVVLSGKLPLVFFDEFDSDKDGMALGWIKSFLMPMQDGRFRDGDSEHPIGKCILVFAGGTAATFEAFAEPCDIEEFKNIKGPDFLSRLRGTISILGPNPKNENDKNYILRRALLLRTLCERKLDMKGDAPPIAEGIIRAMLLVPEFKHGARSMEAILDMSRIDDGIWGPATLPFHSQLALHVDADEFLKLVTT
ncbi:MAG: Ryanodine receptor Ryr [Defluviitaleaceae bacterium]|nr:Ryanodine receptor Ryr [Defluviitaleaceae bacterium]